MSPQTSRPINAGARPDLLNDFGVTVAAMLFRDGLSLDEIAKRGGLEVVTVARIAGLFIARFQAAVLPTLIAAEEARGETDLSGADDLLGYVNAIEAGTRALVSYCADAAGGSA
ncbi:hypothetical protein E4V01_00460 [Methylorubrum sp. Q1]|uniref:hypothetical protein n=1 Tax=Methylorubrum sp. Q1 TaxID=2562453 RepID=UPI0010765B8A|nr:hypothetical protein [Methylorubrum sp. Q1]TFZ61120.1 hypothetical protein E4V01_00460 [Methylorubrum sp. Q1]